MLVMDGLRYWRCAKTKMLIGYARVSTDDQNLHLQMDALGAAGCEKIYTDHLSGVKAARPGLSLAFEVARTDDVLVIWRLDRLGRSLKDLIEKMDTLEKRGIGLSAYKKPSALPIAVVD